MQEVLVLGAGRVARPLVRYLLDQGHIQVTVVDQAVSQADALVAGHPHGTTQSVDIDDRSKLGALIRSHDLAVSLLPAPLHATVAELCISHKKHMVTTSYVSPAMKALDEPAKDAGVMLLNETGLDPGIDHMSAMKIIHDVQDRGGRVVSFKSYCGGLPAPDCNDNPWGYKFSWSPHAVCTACKNAAEYQIDGKKIHIPGRDLFTDCSPGMNIAGVGELEAYPNRDSLSYIDLYGLTGIDTMMRCTLRYPGWCETMKSVVDLGLLDEVTTTYPVGTTFADFMATFVRGGSGSDIGGRVADQLGLEASSAVMQRFDWLGLFSNDAIPVTCLETTPLDILANRMAERMSYGENERDMVVLRHEFRATFPSGPDERIVSTLIEFGRIGGDSAMARTVSLPAAVAAKLILSGQIHATGVHIPVLPEIYDPVLTELVGMGLACVEQTFGRD